MRGWSTALLTALMLGATGAGQLDGAAVPESTQGARVRAGGGQRTIQFVGGRGSWIGVSVRDLGEEDVAKAKLPSGGGVAVEEVHRESPAETAGVKAGDIIVELDGEKVRGTRQFTRLVQETPAGRKVQAAVIRDGQRMALSIEPRPSGAHFFGEFSNHPEIAGVAPVPPAPPAPPVPPVPPEFFEFDELLGRGSTRLGVTVSALQGQLADYFGVKDGVLVTSVTPDSPAAKAGVKAGDVITTVNGANVTSPADLRQRTSRLSDGEELTLSVVRERKPMTLKGKVEGPARRRTMTTI